MGALHAGHQALITKAKELCDEVVVSIFVNPTQFGPHEDLSRYPRDLANDCEKANQAAASLVFAPTVETIYPADFQTVVEVTDVSQGLCGASRPGHFRGVATIVLKLFNLCLPDVAVFGEKDFQQLAVIRRMTIDLSIPVQIVGLPTVRETDGLAMSSRNIYLSKAERQDALVLKHTLDHMTQLATNGAHDARKVLESGRNLVEAHPSVRLEYLALVDSHSLRPVEKITHTTRALIAAHVGSTRLIDNCQLLGA
jgi:pantoate--beta-alanine ligase